MRLYRLACLTYFVAMPLWLAAGERLVGWRATHLIFAGMGLFVLAVTVRRLSRLHRENANTGGGRRP